MANFNVADAKKTPQVVIRDNRGDVMQVITPRDLQVGFEGSPGALILKGALDINAYILQIKTANDANFKIANDKIAYFVQNDSGVLVTCTLPTPPANAGQTHIIKDYRGTATSIIPLRVVTSDGSTIDGQAQMDVSIAFGAIMFVWTGQGWASLALGASGAGSGAAANLQYITWGTEVSLTNSRVLTVTSGHLTLNTTSPNATLGLASVVTAGTYNYPASVTLDAQGRVTAIVTDTAGAAADKNASYVVMGVTSSLPNERALTAGTGIKLVDGGVGGNATISINDSIVATISGSTFGGITKHSAGLSGSLTQLTTGASYIVAGANVTVTSASNGQITISAPSPAASADSGASYVVMGITASLPNERALTAGTGIRLTDAGANSTATLAINDSIVATISGSTFSGVVKFTAGASGSITQLTTGASYIAAGTNVTVTSASNGQITISSTAASDTGASYVVIGTTSSLSNERALTAGTGLTLTDAGANSTVTLAINNSIVATISGSTFSGAVKFSAGLSGSHTNLADGSSFIVAGQNIIVTSASNGQITISSTASGSSSASGADSEASYIVLGLTSSLANERVLTAGSGISIVDNGANNAVVISATQIISGSNKVDQDNYDIIIWRLNELTGNNIINYGTSGSIADLTGSSQLVYGRSGVYDSAIDFRGYNTPTFASSTNSVKPKDCDINISAWIYPYQFLTGVAIVKNLTTGSYDTTSPIILGVNGAFGYPFLQLRSTNATSNNLAMASSRSLALTTWNHFGFSLSGSGTNSIAKFYLNGDFVNSMIISGTIDYGSNGWWSVGGIPISGAESGDYKLNEIRIANVVRDDQWWRDIYLRSLRGINVSGSVATSGQSYVTGTWRDGVNAFITTGSVSIDSLNRSSSQIGSDVFFFVSGNVGLSGTAAGRISAFGGDVKITGTLSIGTGSLYLDSNEVRWDSNTKIFKSASDLKFSDSNNPSGFTLSQLAQSGSTSTSPVDLWIPDMLTWSSTGVTAPIFGGNPIAINSKYYAFGGQSSAGVLTTHIFSASFDDPTAWHDTGRVMPLTFTVPRVCVIADKLYMFGAYASGDDILSASISDPLTWADTGVNLSQRRDNSQLVFLDTQMFLYKGHDGVSAGYNTLLTASFSNPLAWTAVAGAGSTAWESSAFAVGNEFYGIGGVGPTTQITIGSKTRPTTIFLHNESFPISAKTMPWCMHIGDSIWMIGIDNTNVVAQMKIGTKTWKYYAVLPTTIDYPIYGMVWLGGDGRIYLTHRTTGLIYMSGRTIVTLPGGIPSSSSNGELAFFKDGTPTSYNYYMIRKNPAWLVSSSYV